MAMSGKKWDDRQENYADGITLRIIGSTATAINVTGATSLQPVVVYSLTVSVNPAAGSGDVVLIDGSATADSGDTRKCVVIVASAASQTYTNTITFPRGLVFDVGLLVSAATITGAITLTYKPRFAT